VASEAAHRPAGALWQVERPSHCNAAFELIEWSWTGIRVVKHDGSEHHGVGIHPTVPVSATVKGIAEGRDEVLERAIEIVRA
jgi:hypothetical protein